VIDADSIHEQFGRSVSFSLLLHTAIVVFIWGAVPRLGQLATRLGLAGAESKPEMEVVHFRFQEVTADVSESSRVEEAPDTEILGRFNSQARDMVRDDNDTSVPAGGTIGFDNSIPGTGAEEDSPGVDGSGDSEAAPAAPNEAQTGSSERTPRTLMDAMQGVQPGLRDALPSTVEQMMTGKRKKPESPGHGARRSGDLKDAGARLFGEYSFSTRAWDYEPFWYHMRRKLYGAWHSPAAYAYGIIEGGWTLVRAVVEPDGTLSSVEVIETRGHESLHRASKAAMEGAAPFRALPVDFPEENLVVTVRFIYPPPGARDVP
jgi:hypothetical protein